MIFIKMPRYRVRRVIWRDRPLYNKRIPYQDGFGIAANNRSLRDKKKESGTRKRKRFLDLSNKLADKIQHAEHSILRGMKKEGKYIKKEVGKGLKWVEKEAVSGVQAFVAAKATKWAVEGLTTLFDVIAAPETGGASLAALPEELAAEEIEMTALETAV